MKAKTDKLKSERRTFASPLASAGVLLPFARGGRGGGVGRYVRPNSPLTDPGAYAPGSPRFAFTLVEMLVAVAVVVVMMTLFTTIFQLATGAMAKQKGLSENDQRVRLVITMLRNDLASGPTDRVTNTQTRQCRTFRILIPYGAGETAPPIYPIDGTSVNGTITTAIATPTDRSGYFYISEGNPLDDTDDDLQLTVNVPASSNDRLFGRAAILLTDNTGNFGPAGTTAPSQLVNGSLVPITPYPPSGGTAPPLVQAPSVGSYFANQPEFDDILGVPNQVGSSTTAEVSYFLRNGTLYRRVMLVRDPNVSTLDDHTPADGNSIPLLLNAYTVAGGRNFWTDFDYSVFYGVAGAPVFHGLGDLAPTALNIGSTLASPGTRWGFDATSAAGAGLGLPIEYVGGTYIGRYTHAETSDPTFGYPALISAGNPMQYSYANTTLAVANGAVTQYPNGTRRGEDVLMSNVLAFDIKVWDPAASLGPDNAPGIAGVDDDGINLGNNATGIDDNGEIGAFGSDDGAWVDIGHSGLQIGTNYFGFYKKPLDNTGSPNPLATPKSIFQQPVRNAGDEPLRHLGAEHSVPEWHDK